MARERSANLTQSNVARLVEAERQWQASLDAARTAATERVEVARAELLAAENSERDALAAIVAARERDLVAARREAVARVESEFRDHVAQYESVDDVLVDRIARSLSDRAPWFTTTAAS